MYAWRAAVQQERGPRKLRKFSSSPGVGAITPDKSSACSSTGVLPVRPRSSLPSTDPVMGRPMDLRLTAGDVKSSSMVKADVDDAADTDVTMLHHHHSSTLPLCSISTAAAAARGGAFVPYPYDVRTSLKLNSVVAGKAGRKRER